MRWFRVYASTLNNPKFQRLSDTLKVFLFNLWCVAAEYDGVIPAAQDLSFLLRSQQIDVERNLEQLQAAGFLDETERGLQPHDWNQHQYVSDTSTGRVKKFRKKQDETFRETQDETFRETQDETFRETQDETEMKRPRADTEQIQSREEKSQTAASTSPKTGSATAHGTRFSLDAIPADWTEWCQSDLGWNSESAQTVFLSFRDYWVAKPGAGGRKADWLGTWRNWCRREGQTSGSGGQKPATAPRPISCQACMDSGLRQDGSMKACECEAGMRLRAKQSPRQAAIDREWAELANK